MKTIVRVKIGPLELVNSELELVEVVQELGQHTTARLEFIRDEALDLRLDGLLGQPVTIELVEELAPPTTVFEGAIRDGRQSHLLNVGSRFLIDAISPSDKYEFSDTVHYPNATLESIAGQLGVKVDEVPSKPAMDYYQWGETQFDFLKRLAYEHGAFLVTTGPVVTIRSGFPTDATDLDWGIDLLEVTARGRPVNNGVTGASYEPQRKSTHAHAGIRATPETLGGAAALQAAVNGLTRKTRGGGDPFVVEPGGRTPTHGDFKKSLQAESERMLGTAVTVECLSTRSTLMVGGLVNLVSGTNFSLATTGKLGLVKVTHSFKDQIYTNRFIATPWKDFTDFTQPPPRRIYGPVTGEVTDNRDPDKLGRVKVAYRWHAGGETNWVRIASVHAGLGRGVQFLPEIGDEVLVAFERGDPERPVVIGSLWNGVDKPPEVTEKNGAKRLISRSGNTIQLIDDDGEETIEVFTRDAKAILQMTHKGGTPVITIKSEGDIAIEAKNELRMKCQKFSQDVASDSLRKIGGDESVDVGRNAIIKAGADAGLTGLNAIVKGGANVEVVAGGLNNIAGSLVHLQPPGFVAKPIAPKPLVYREADLGKRTTPGKSAVNRTADPETPRSG